MSSDSLPADGVSRRYGAEVLRGRGVEQEALRAVVARAREGEGAALVLRGQPGVGKSALLDDLLADVAASEADVVALRTGGVESEAPLPFAALHRLLRPVLSRLTDIPEPQAQALRVAFGEAADHAGDRHLVFLGTLSLLSEVGGEHPVLAVVDDAHWLDDASAAALLFAARRVGGERVALLFAVRDDQTGAFDARDLATLGVNGVSPDAAGEVLADRVAVPVADHVLEELVEATAGNPLGLLELGGALTPGQLGGQDRLPARLPVTEGVERAFLDRYRSLDAAAQAVLLLAAADDSGDPVVVTRAANALDGSAEGLDAAEQSGLLRVDDGRLALRHPLVRTAIYGAATSSRRRRAHRALADALEGTRHDDRRAWHLAASVDGPDPDAVAALDESADRSSRRGGHEAAAAAWTRAAELTLDPHQRAVRLLAAARAHLAAGRPADADLLTRAALVDADDPLLRADLLQLQGQVEWNTRSLDEGHRMVCRAAATAAPHDPAQARVLAMLAAALASFGARRTDAPDPTTIAPAPALDAPAEEQVTQALLEGFTAVSREDWAEAATAMRRAWDLPLPADVPPLLHHNLAIAAVHLGDDERVVALHDRQLQHARDAGAVNMIEHALTRGAISRIATGAWSQAANAAQEALLLDRNLGLEELVAVPLAQLAVIAVLRGDPTAPEQVRDLEVELERRPPHGATVGFVLGLAHWAAACQADVTPAAALHHLQQIHLPVMRGLTSFDRIETAMLAGRRDLAEDWLDELRRFAEGTDMAWAWAAVHHARAVMGLGDVEESFTKALEWHRRSTRLPMHARTQLALGEHLRRHRRRTAARVPLREALETFEGIGAATWAERARRGLRASGETARRGASLVPTDLTPQEAQIAGLVREGLTNKDVATRLFISPRTVDFHLRNIFTKLGITSRTELAALRGDQG